MLLLTPTSTTNTEDQVFICHLAYCTSVLTGFSPNLASRTFFFSVHKSIKNINQLLLLTCLKVFCWLFISLQISRQLAKHGLHNPASCALCLVPLTSTFLLSIFWDIVLFPIPGTFCVRSLHEKYMHFLFQNASSLTSSGLVHVSPPPERSSLQSAERIGIPSTSSTFGSCFSFLIGTCHDLAFVYVNLFL